MPSGRIRNRGHLPHWETGRGIYFVTFRLADSLPQSVLRKLRQSEQAKPPEERRLASQVEDYLDSGAGSCCLFRPEIAKVVADSLRKFDGIRCRMLAWCVMPNHVHVVFQPKEEFALAGILHSWKSFTALEINRQLCRTGALWQKEYYDHLIRDRDQLGRAIAYTAGNPVRAKMKDWPFVYVSEEAFGGRFGVNIVA